MPQVRLAHYVDTAMLASHVNGVTTQQFLGPSNTWKKLFDPKVSQEKLAGDNTSISLPTPQYSILFWYTFDHQITDQLDIKISYIISILWHFFLWRAYSVSTARCSPKIRKFKNSKNWKKNTKIQKFENSKIQKIEKPRENSKIRKFEKTKKHSKIRKFEKTHWNSKFENSINRNPYHKASSTGHASGRENHRQRTRNESAPIEKCSIHVAKISVQDIQ